MRHGSLFTGTAMLDVGVLDALGGTLGDLAWVCDSNPGASKVLAHRLPGVPNIGDITTVKWTPDCEGCGNPTALDRRGSVIYVCQHCQRLWPVSYFPGAPEPVDVLTGGFPCTDVSAAGKRAGLAADTRSGLWSHMATAIDRLRPPLVVIENVRGLLTTKAGRDAGVADPDPDPFWQYMEDTDAEETAPDPAGDDLGSDDPDMGDDDDPGPVLLRALGAVLGSLADIGYDAAWTGLRAADIGACHGRWRVFILAWPTDTDRSGSQIRECVGGDDAPQRPTAIRSDRDWPATDTEDVGPVRGRDARGWRHGPPNGGDTSPYAGGDGRERRQELHRRPAPGQPTPLRADSHGHPGATTATSDANRNPVRQQPVGEPRGSREAVAGLPIQWGDYAPAVHRWEHTLGRVAPAPTEPATKGGQRLSPRFVEWLMGWPAGWVTDVPGLSRNEQLKICGNGVVPQQASAAVRYMLPLLPAGRSPA